MTCEFGILYLHEHTWMHKNNIRWCQWTKSMEICQLKATIAGRIGNHALSPLLPQGSLHHQTKVRAYNSSHIQYFNSWSTFGFYGFSLLDFCICMKVRRNFAFHSGGDDQKKYLVHFLNVSCNCKYYDYFLPLDIFLKLHFFFLI
jgi:hypothetical protein